MKLSEILTWWASFSNISDVGKKDHKDMAKQATQLEGNLTSARAIMQKFVNKVDTGRARSKETYREMKAWLEE